MHNDYTDDIINNLDLYLVFFNNNDELIHYSKNLTSLWRMDLEFLNSTPSLIDFLQVLREKGVYPEKDNFKKYCENLLNILKFSTNYEKTENIILPNSITISEKIIKLNEGLLITWEDTTNMWNTIHNLNNQKNIYQKIIDKNPEAILVVASNGIIESYNGKFLEKVNMSALLLDEKPHIRDIIPSILKHFDNKDEKEQAKLIGNILSNRNFNYQIPLPNDAVLNISGISLPNTNMFLIWQKSSNNNYIIDEFKINNNLLQLHNDFVVDLNLMLGSPLATIMGFAELLQNEYVGGLNLRQKEYIAKILEKAELINQEFNYKIELSNLDMATNIVFEAIDLNVILANILHQVRPRITNKNIKINLDVKEQLNTIISNEELLKKALSLLLLYLIEQNSANSILYISLLQNKEQTTFTIRDSSKQPLLSEYDCLNRYDIKLSLNILDKIKAQKEYSYKNKNYRTLSIILDNTLKE